MTDQEMIKRWAQTWKEVGPELELMRLREVRDEDTALSLELLAPAFEQALRAGNPASLAGSRCSVGARRGLRGTSTLLC